MFYLSPRETGEDRGHYALNEQFPESWMSLLYQIERATFQAFVNQFKPQADSAIKYYNL